MKKAIGRSFLFAVIFLVGLLAIFTGCSKDNPPPKDEQTTDYEFVFSGESEFSDGKTYTISVYGNKDAEKTADVRVKELPTLEMDANWVFVEGKGYKIYFNDSLKSFVYSAYDVPTKTFSFKYKVNLGQKLGSRQVAFSYTDEAFAAKYDGVGLGPVPPVFVGIGYSGGRGTTETGITITCKEDGTVEAVTASNTRTGTYTYNAQTNVFHFEFDEQEYPSGYIRDYDSNPDNGKEYRWWDGMSNSVEWPETDGPRNLTASVDTVYDAATGTYSMTVVAVERNYVTYEVTYTPEA